ncbi:unnamed protein product, partial [marine sediment metagenome]
PAIPQAIWTITTSGYEEKVSSSLNYYWWKKWHFVMNFSFARKEQWNGDYKTEEGTMAQEGRTYTSGLSVDSRFRPFKRLHIPIFRKVIELKEDVRFKTSVNMVYKDSELNVEKDRTTTYNGSLSIDYNVGSNLRVSIGGGGSYFHNRQKDMDINDYMTLNGSAQATIRF